jgi:hypothetical protein
MNAVEARVHTSARDRAAAEVMKLAGITPDVARFLARERAKLLPGLIKAAVDQAAPTMPAHVILGTLAPESMLGADMAADITAARQALRAEEALHELSTAAGEAIIMDGGKISQTDVVHQNVIDAGYLAEAADRERLVRVARLFDRLNAHKGTRFRIAVVGDVSPELAKFLKDNGITNIGTSAINEQGARASVESALNPRGLQSTLTAMMTGREAYFDSFAREVDSLIIADDMNLFGAATASFVRHRVVPGRGEFRCTDFTAAGREKLQGMMKRSVRQEDYNSVRVKEERREVRRQMDDYILSDMEADVAF